MPLVEKYNKSDKKKENMSDRKTDLSSDEKLVEKFMSITMLVFCRWIIYIKFIYYKLNGQIVFMFDSI